MPDVLSLLHTVSSQPLILAGAIVLATFIFEDGATIAAAMLTLEGLISPGLALGALYFGIVTGDLGLYWVGRAAAYSDRVRRYIGEVRLRAGRRWLHRRLGLALFGARFTPGMRMPTYVTSGFLRIRFDRFALYAILAATVWVTIVYFVVLTFGQLVADVMGDWVWLIGVVMVVAIVMSHRRLLRRRRKV